MKVLIKKLTEAWGPSGYEHHVRKLIQEEVVNLADEITVDPLGNLICRVGHGGPKVMIAAHMDEIGVMSTFTEKSGYIRFDKIGAILPNALSGNRVRFENGMVGVIGSHKGSDSKLEDFFIDADDGTDEATVEAGSPATFWREMEERGNRIISKALDDRIGCVVAIETMRKLNKQTPNEVYFVFTVQEEVGIRGAKTSGYAIDPDIAIALDVTATGDTPKGLKMGVKLGAGAAIKVHDKGLVVPPAIIAWMKNCAEENNIPYQMEMLSVGTTDASSIQISRSGVPSGCISIPCRYVHTVSETVDIRDVHASIDLLYALLNTPATV